jgi:Icc-related predicted phosphoesterase
MRIMAFADIHSSSRGLLTVNELTDKYHPGLIIIAGDVTSFGPVEFAEHLKKGLPTRTLFVPGNCDIPAVADLFCSEKAMNIHLKKEVIDDIPFVGVGGWIASPALSEEYGIRSVDAVKKITRLVKKETVLVTHVPPYGHLDVVPSPQYSAVEHIGNLELNMLVEATHPALVISGHVHECRGVEEADGTLFVNPGPAKNGYGAVIEFDRMHRKARLVEL